MGDQQQPANVDEPQQQNAPVPQYEQNAVAPHQEPAADPRPHLMNVREVILPPPLPPMNGIIQQHQNGPNNHDEVLLNLEEHLGNFENLADLIARRDVPPMDLEEIRALLDVIDIVDEEENAENDDERCHNPGPEAEARDNHDDSDDGEPDVPQPVAAVVYVGVVEKE